MRINRYLALCGVASRRAAEALIKAGRVRVNGTAVTELATFVEAGRDRVELDGAEVLPEPEAAYILLHKPVGYITTARDPQGRPTVMSLVPPQPRVFPVGRLDQDTSGALLLTNDGELAHRLLHPRYKVDKEYLALVEGSPDEAALESLRTGILLPGESRPTAPAEVAAVARNPGSTRVRLVIREGRKRQVRNMMDAMGHPVIELARIRFGPLELGDLEAGAHRPLTREEIAALRRGVQAGAGGRSSNRRGRTRGNASSKS